MRHAPSLFVVARNPDAASRLPYLVRLPLGGGGVVILKARAPWPTTARVYCHLHEGDWPDDAEIVEEVPAALCQRRAIDLVLERGQNSRSQFVFTEVRGRPVTTSRVAVPAGDYGVRAGDDWLAVVERKSIENLASSLSDGTLAFQLARLAELPLAAVVVEGRYPALFAVPRAPAGWLPDIVARLQLRYRTIPIVFADSRKFAEEWTYRFLAAALEDLGPPSG